MPIIPGLCSACGSGGSSGGEFEHNSVVLCDTLADGTVVAAIILVQEYDEVTGLPVGAPVPTDPETGLPYVVQGTLQACSSEAPLPLGDVCYSQLGPFTTLIPNDATSVPPATGLGNPGQQYVATVANWGGSGVPLSIATFGDAPGDVGDAVNTAGAAIPGHIDLGATFLGVTVDFEFFDAANNERLTGINQPFTLGAGTDGTIGDGGTSYTPGPISYGSGTANLIFAGPVRTIDFTFLADAVVGFPASIAAQQVTATAVVKAAFAVQCDSCIGPITYRDAVTGATVAAANLTNCPAQTDISAPVVVVPQAPVFAGFVCDVFAGTPLIPRVLPTCTGNPLIPLVSNTDAFFVDGVTEAPAGTFTCTGPNTPFWAVSKVPFSDENAGFCSVEFTMDGSTGDDPLSFQLFGSGADFSSNPVNLDAVWITAIEAILGVGDATDIPLPFTATAFTGDGHSVTITVTGPTTHFQMFAGNGCFAFRESDGDGLSATVRLDFLTPMNTFNVVANVLVPSVGSLSGFQQALATPGTSAIPAQPAAIFEVKQFRNNDGTAFYENLDGSAHAVVGTVGECGEYTQEILCDSLGVSFLRVYRIAEGTVVAVQDYDLSGATFAPTGTVGICSETLATFRHTPVEVLCWTETSTGLVTEFLRRYLITQDGVNVVAVLDTLLDGTTPFLASNAGTVAECANSTPEIECTSTVLGTICYTPPPTTTVSPGTHRGPDDWAGSTTVGANGGPQTITNANFAGAGITVISTDSFGGGIIPTSRIAMAHPAATEVLTLDLGAPRLNVTLLFNSFGPAGTEVIDNFSPAFTSISGDGTAALANTQVLATLPAGVVSVHFAGPVQTINYHARTTAGQFALQSVEFDEIITTVNAQALGTAAVVRDCATGVVSYVDLASGATIDLTAVTIVDCECSNTVLGTICYTPPPTTTPGVARSTGFAAATQVGTSPGARTYTVSNWGGGTVPLVATIASSTGGLPNGDGAQVGVTAVTPNHIKLDLGEPLVNVSFRVFAFDVATNEKLINISPPFTSVTGGTFTTIGFTEIDAVGPGITFVDVHFAGPVQVIDLDYTHTGTAGVGINTISGSTAAVTTAQTIGTAAVVQDCSTGVVSYVDLTTGAVLNIAAVTVVDCGSADAVVTRDVEESLVCAGGVTLLRTATFNGQTGALLTETFRGLNGATVATPAAYTQGACNIASSTPAISADHFNALPGTPWTPAAIPAGRRLTSVTYTVLSGTATVVDAVGATSIAAIPAGYTATWSVANDLETLTPPVSITSVGGSVIVLMTTAL